MTTTNILVLASNKEALGAIESLTIKESRSENGTTNVRLEINRMRLLRLRMSETFERGQFHVASQIYPVHIVVVEDKVETIRATNVWLTGITTAYTTDEWIITEGVEAECEFVTGTQTFKTSSESD